MRGTEGAYFARYARVWAVSAPSGLSAAARKQIDAAEVFVSAASIWEISIKSSIGKLDADPDELLAGVEPAGFPMLPVSGEHAAKVAKLPPIDKDLFDRILVAQASAEPMILLTNDACHDRLNTLTESG